MKTQMKRINIKKNDSIIKKLNFQTIFKKTIKKTNFINYKDPVVRKLIF